jgi:hypothetical protein
MTNTIKLKRYIVFAYEAYYPGGGWSDYKGSYDSCDEAFREADKFDIEYCGGIEIIDSETCEDVYVYKKDREGLFV